MNGIKHIRENLLISQEHLAVYLDITRSQLAMAEAYERDLPTNALIKLNALFFETTDSINIDEFSLAADVLQQQQNELNIFLQEQNNSQAQKIKQLQNELLAMQTAYTQAFKLLQSVRSIQQNLADTPENKKDILWLAVTETMAIEKIKSNGLVEQQKLQTKINTLS